MSDQVPREESSSAAEPSGASALHVRRGQTSFQRRLVVCYCYRSQIATKRERCAPALRIVLCGMYGKGSALPPIKQI